MGTLLAVGQLARLEASLLGFLAVFIPTWTRTHDLQVSAGRALPLLFICICAYIANDLYDVENDAVNHPLRPLPSRRIALITVAIVYFACLATALFTTRAFVDPRTAFWYYGLTTLAISYGYLLDCARAAKAPYVAAVISAPVVIVASSYPEHRIYTVAVAAFLASIGRELCKDILDRSGDPESGIAKIPPTILARFAFGSQAAGLIVLAHDVNSVGDILVVAMMCGLLALAAKFWFAHARYRWSVGAMKTMFGMGLWFLA